MRKRDMKAVIIWHFSSPFTQIIHKVSLKSRENRIYVLINVIERVKSSPSSTKYKYDLYSSNIVFDRHGCIISR